MKRIESLESELQIERKRNKTTEDPLEESSDIEEQILYNAKESGFIRDGPQFKPIPKSPIKSFICSSCAKSFKTEGELDNHTEKHSETSDWNCNSCAKSFKTEGEQKNIPNPVTGSATIVGNYSEHKGK